MAEPGTRRLASPVQLANSPYGDLAARLQRGVRRRSSAAPTADRDRTGYGPKFLLPAIWAVSA